jgi:hypothetical protein
MGVGFGKSFKVGQLGRIRVTRSGISASRRFGPTRVGISSRGVPYVRTGRKGVHVSNRGVGFSVGTSKARVGVGPRGGLYTRLGGGGLYFMRLRKKKGSPSLTTQAATHAPPTMQMSTHQVGYRVAYATLLVLSIVESTNLLRHVVPRGVGVVSLLVYVGAALAISALRHHRQHSSPSNEDTPAE